MMSDDTSRYRALTLQLAQAVGERTSATTRVQASGPTLVSQMRQDLAEHHTRIRDRRTVRRSVLLVEDDPGLRDLLTYQLEHNLRVPVFGAASAAEAEMRWRAERCAVVVCDLYLGTPSGVGTSFADEFLTGLPREVRTILLSGVADRGHLELTAAVTGSIPLQKPADKLVEVVRAALMAATPAATA